MGEIVIAAIADSPKLHTGFAQVSYKTYEGFMNAGFKLYVFGILDWQPDINKVLPYPFWPTSPFDPMGKEECIRFVEQVEPDIVWIMIDPGNLLTYAISLVNLNKDRKERGKKTFKILAYPPVEGKPLSMFQATAVKHIMQSEGEVVFWCKSAAEEAHRWLPDYNFDYIYFGSDHIQSKPHTPEQKKILRQRVGLDKYFVIGSVGVNKRTKGYPTLIYAATHLKEWGYGDQMRFYCHTDPLNPVMQGHHLVDLADRYGVRGMFLWKPDNNLAKHGNPYIGDDRVDGTFERVSQLRKPRTGKRRQQLWQSYAFDAKLDCIDLYVDASQVEGAGLPQLEAMRRGIPLISVHDDSVRDEWYGDVAYMVDPLPSQLWETWHTGARLVTVDPMRMALAIETLYKDEQLRQEIARKCMERTHKFTWAKTQAAMNRKVIELYG